MVICRICNLEQSYSNQTTIGLSNLKIQECEQRLSSTRTVERRDKHLFTKAFVQANSRSIDCVCAGLGWRQGEDVHYYGPWMLDIAAGELERGAYYLFSEQCNADVWEECWDKLWEDGSPGLTGCKIIFLSSLSSKFHVPKISNPSSFPHYYKNFLSPGLWD